MDSIGQQTPDSGGREGAPASTDKNRIRIIRYAHVFAGMVTGAIVMLVAMAIHWPEVGPLAGTAITVIGAVAGAALGVCALALGSRPSS